MVSLKSTTLLLLPNISMIANRFIIKIQIYQRLRQQLTQRFRMEQEDLYDEFGNYIGPEIESSSDQQPNKAENVDEQEVENAQVQQGSNQHRIILHQDKKYYQTHEEMYPQAEIMIEQQDRQAIEIPIITKIVEKHYDHTEVLEPIYSIQYLRDLMKNPAIIRNIMISGHLHHGKTLITDMLIQQSHQREHGWDLQKNYRWLDTRKDQQERLISIKAMPMTLLLPDLIGKHYIVNLIDTPGHLNFSGQVTAASRLVDGIALVIDVIQGNMLGTQKVIRLAIRQKLKVVVIINKIDRLIVEMKIPPQDAYLKIKHVLEQVNGIFQKISSQLGVQNDYLIAPTLNNVVFASGEYSFMFSIQSFVRKYTEKNQNIDPVIFKKLLWGDYYYNHQTRKFAKRPYQQFRKRTFVEFVLDPIYKIFAHTVGKDRQSLENFLYKNLNISLTAEQYKLNIKTMIKLIFNRYFKDNNCLVSSVVQHIDPPHLRTSILVNKNYRGDDSDFKRAISECKAENPLMINITKLYHNSDYKAFDGLGRIISGTVKKGQLVKVMGENYEAGQDEDVFVKPITKLYLLQGRFKMQVDSATAGNIVLIQGIDQSIVKTATIVDAAENHKNVDIMIPLKFWTQPVIKVAIEPLIPSQLPKMIQAIRKVNKSYPLLKTKVQESGQHILIGNGQLHLESVLHDIRNLYSDIEIRISDPCVCFAQTVAETSGIPCYADTPNKKNRIKTLAGPLQKGISDQVEKQLINIDDSSQLRQFLESKYEWDMLASSNVWSFGPQHYGTNVLINDSLPSATDQDRLQRVKNTIVQGFRWSTRQGPLCDQPMRNVKFRVIEAELSPNSMQCPPGQLIPTARRSFYSSFLTANPKIMEPMCLTQIQCTTQQSIEAVFAVLAKRRGSIQSQTPKSGTPHYIIRAMIPVIQTLGFQTDLRVHTVGQAFCMSTFDHWQVVPGDPLDKKIQLKPLEVMQPYELAREFMIKTRRRKGLNEEVSIVKYFDDINIKDLLKNDLAFKDFI